MTLEPRIEGAAFDETDFTLVSISNVVPPAGGATDATFTLTVTWSRTVTGVTVANMATKLADLAYLVTFTAPATGFVLPRAGTYALAGGSEPGAPTAATVSIIGNE